MIDSNSKYKKQDMDVVRRIVELCTQKNPKEFTFFHGDGEFPDHQQGWESMPFLTDLILLLIHLKSERPNDPFFYGKGLEYQEQKADKHLLEIDKEIEELKSKSFVSAEEREKRLRIIKETQNKLLQNYETEGLELARKLEKTAKIDNISEREEARRKINNEHKIKSELITKELNELNVSLAIEQKHAKTYTDKAELLKNKKKSIKEEQQKQTVDFYRTFFYSLKGIYHTSLGDSTFYLGDEHIAFEGCLLICWKYLKECLSVSTKQGLNPKKFRTSLYKEDSRAYIIDLINSIPKEKFRAIQKKIISQVLNSPPKNTIDLFINEFCKNKKIKNAYATTQRRVISTPTQVNIGHLGRYREPNKLGSPFADVDAIRQGLFNSMYLKMAVRSKKNFIGHISLQDSIDEPEEDITGNGDFIDYKTNIDNLITKNHAQGKFYYAQFDLAIIDTNIFTQRRSNGPARTIHTLGGAKEIGFQSLKQALKGIKDNGYLIAILDNNSRQPEFWARFLRASLIHDIKKASSRLSPTVIVGGNNKTILVLKKSAKPQKIKFVDFRDQKKKGLNKAVKNIFETKTKQAKTIYFEDYLKLHYCSLDIERYFMPKQKGVNMSSFSTPLFGKRVKVPENTPLITRLSLLNVDSRGLDLDRLRQVKNTSYQRHLQKRITTKIERSCLLLSTNIKSGSGVSPVWFDFQGEPIYLGVGINAMSIDEEKVSGPYLQHALKQKNVLNQIKALSFGAGVYSRIRMYDLMHNVKIEIPTKEKQVEYVTLKKKEQITKLEKEIEQIAGKEIQKKYEIFDWLKHRLRQNLKKIRDGNKKLKTFVSKLDDEIAKEINRSFMSRYDNKESIEDFLQRVDFAGDEISKTLKQFESYKLGKKTLTDFADVAKILESYQNTGKTYDVEVEIEMETSFGEDDIVDKLEDDEAVEEEKISFKPALLINEQGLKQILDETITNAEKYGQFSASKKGKIVINIATNQPKTVVDEKGKEIDMTGKEIYGSGEQVILSIKNNGAPLPKGWGKKEFSERNKRGPNASDKPGSGNGGSYIAEHADDFCEEWELINLPKEDFPVEFIFKFKTYLKE